MPLRLEIYRQLKDLRSGSLGGPCSQAKQVLPTFGAPVSENLTVLNAGMACMACLRLPVRLKPGRDRLVTVINGGALKNSLGRRHFGEFDLVGT